MPSTFRLVKTLEKNLRGRLRVPPSSASGNTGNTGNSGNSGNTDTSRFFKIIADVICEALKVQSMKYEFS